MLLIGYLKDNTIFLALRNNPSFSGVKPSVNLTFLT